MRPQGSPSVTRSVRNPVGEAPCRPTCDEEDVISGLAVSRLTRFCQHCDLFEGARGNTYLFLHFPNQGLTGISRGRMPKLGSAAQQPVCGLPAREVITLVSRALKSYLCGTHREVQSALVTSMSPSAGITITPSAVARGIQMFHCRPSRARVFCRVRIRSRRAVLSGGRLRH